MQNTSFLYNLTPNLKHTYWRFIQNELTLDFITEIPLYSMAESGVTQVLCSGLDNCTIVRGNTIRKILVPFDNSSYAARSFGTALDMAKNRGASIVVISVIQDDISKSWVNDTPTREKNMTKSSKDILKEGIRMMQDQAKKILSVAVYNHYKRLTQKVQNDETEIEKSVSFEI